MEKKTWIEKKCGIEQVQVLRHMGQSVGERQGGSQTIHKQSNGEQVDKTRKTFRLVANKSGKPHHYHRP